MRWVLPCPKGCEEPLADEVRAINVQVTDVRPTAVHAVGTLSEGYRLCLWSRVASRVLMPLVTFEAADDTALYDTLRALSWWEHFDPTRTFAIRSSQAPRSSTPSHYWIQRAKDAIVDAFRDHAGTRPSVDKKSPDIQFHLHIGENTHELALDFSGEGLHRRGYRQSGGRAPLKENLAAAILYLAGWPRAASRGLSLVDPTCGSGTLLIEAALMATHCAPGLLRARFGFENWLAHDDALFLKERNEAVAARKADCPAAIHGFDASETALSHARENLRAAGVEEHVSLARQPVTEMKKPSDHGIVVCNPPYGHRLGEAGTLFLFYQSLGDILKREFDGWTAYVFAAQEGNLKHLGLRPSRKTVLFNGAIECRLLEIPIVGVPNAHTQAPGWRKPSDKAEMFVNRIRKNRKKWERWAKRNDIDCYRLYDADIPEYDVAVDRYQSKAVVHIYQRAHQTEDDLTKQRIQDVLITLPETLGISGDDVVVKVRHRHDQGDQYARLAERESELTVVEAGLRFVVNLEDRIDTGLFLDHRTVRSYARKHSRGKQTLNLFAYTCSVSVAAAVGGASQTTSVDLSNTYLDWGRRNFEANDLDARKHRFFRSDAMRWITKNRDKYDWVFINPPTFSRSKKTKDDFNVHQDHPGLIEQAMRSVRPDGELLFTTHAKSFRLDRAIEERYAVEDCGSKFVPEDFARSPFEAFRIRRLPGG
ncbi:MAG: bifunctional 23S rRNA (guanine(2069)-N(7))-methyltransferase RlmK/23S rRNA (guanine(2445)-N(2))-methyltransferase RlmL [Myxococcales bacterium]|nr:bifunctional 23S rRNA (guanine(2069)-N(7))-methyltransferase RlmK/23S rRNA (guanine(2445)-N(2))-methyltransferase RlmL [Myxococcales bacterium]MDH3485423.1 bifunctional 23S rRNA (guanine(2069)-N(7))-methyltransferase RlmK/23S rRNA (guanine(2445)-N(2))-methyltransferase RlmL [Myxococcales bacterium]